MSALKKIFFFSLLLFFMSLLFWGVYNISFKDKTAPQKQNEAANVAPTSTPDSSENQTTLSAISAVSSESFIFPTLSSNGDSLIYFTPTGQLFNFDFDGKNIKSLSDKNISGLINVSWSPDKSKAILKIKNSENNYSFSLYDLSLKNITPIKNNVDEISWANSSEKIFYKYYDPNSKERTLNISDPNGTNWKKLADLAVKKISIAQIPPNGSVSFWNLSDAYAETNLESISLLGENKKNLFKGKFGADYLWDNLGNNALISHTDVKGGNKMQLATINYNGGEYKNLNIPTFVSKCAWSKNGKTVYYALPGGIPDNSILPNDYNDRKFNTVDTFWKVDIETGEKTRLVELNEIKDKYDAEKIFLNQDESMIFFTNRLDGKLYRINL